MKKSLVAAAIFSVIVIQAAFAYPGIIPLVPAGPDVYGNPTYKPKDSEPPHAYSPQPPWHNGDTVQVDGAWNWKVVCDDEGNCRLVKPSGASQNKIRQQHGDIY